MGALNVVSEEEIWKDILGFDPIIKDINGKIIEYQRGLVWSLEQKQMLIESIYNQINIGTIVLRNMGIINVFNKAEKGFDKHNAFFQVVDGKQRFLTIIDFTNNKFPDIRGYYWDDLSAKAQGEFKKEQLLTIAEMDEGTTDKDVIEMFLTLNYTGVPMSKEHIEFVKSIKL